MAEAESEINFPSFQIDFSLSTINYFASFDLTDRVPYFPISFRFALVVSAHAIAATIKKQYKLSKYLGDICRNYFRVTFISKMRCNLHLTMAQQREKIRVSWESKQYFHDCLILIEKDAVMLIMTSILQAVLFTRADLSNVTPLS